MDILTILLIAFGLSMDAFAVSITTGLAMKNLKLNPAPSNPANGETGRIIPPSHPRSKPSSFLPNFSTPFVKGLGKLRSFQRRGGINHALTIGAWFGSFQAIMPVIGWLAGLSLRNFISEIDHWIAFGLLAFVGSKMIYESFQLEKEGKSSDLNTYILLMLAVATSIDALAVGLSFSFLHVAIAMPVIIIGLVTFIMSFTGVIISNKIGHFFEKKIEIIGGAILIVIGIKILFQHLI